MTAQTPSHRYSLSRADFPGRRSSVSRLPGLSAGVLLLLLISGLLHASDKPVDKSKKKLPEPSALDRYIQEALGSKDQLAAQQAPGSLWSPASRLTDLGADVRASQVDDLVTILVSEQASAVVTGDVKTSRVSSVKASVNSVFGPKSPAGALTNLANASGDTELAGAGSTSRGAQISATLSARVTHVLPNGYLVLEGSKDVQVASERQEVVVRGIIRPADLSPGNVVTSNQLAQMEVRVNGKGVIGDAVRRPNFLYRLFLGLIPF